MMPEGTPPVRSYLAVPVRGRSGEILGGMIYGHTGPACFDAECEDLVVTVASQAAIAIDNFRLADNLSHEIALSDAARSLQRQTADRLRQALEAADLGTWSWDRATDLLDLDDRARLLFNVREGEIVTRTALRERMVLIDDQQKTAESLERALRSGGLYRAEYRVEIGGVYAWIAASGLAVMGHGPDGPIITGMVGTVQDVTVRKTQEATLRESEKLAATGRLAATIAHEINNPLEAVTNLIYLCKTDPTVPQHAQRLLETADAELARVAQIAQQTLGFYRDTTRPIQIDLNELLHGVVDLFARKLHYCKLAYQLDLEPDLHIFGLKGEIRQVFSNLFVNAIDASTHGTIRVRAQKRTWHGQPGVVVIIADEGAGIPAVIRDRLFSPFFTTKQSVGTGLGLWVTRGIVEKQGGSVTFRTRTQPPSGTVFRVFLPSCDPLPITQ
jgi:signal transduction histidine kinase